LTEIDSSVSRPVPKIELHVHLEDIQVHTLMTWLAQRLPLPADTVEGSPTCTASATSDTSSRSGADTSCLRTRRLRQVVADYAAAAASHGAVYLEGRSLRPSAWPARQLERSLNGYCDGAQQAERAWVVVRLTPIPLGIESTTPASGSSGVAFGTARGRLGVEGWTETRAGTMPVLRHRQGRRSGSVPHAGEVGGAASVGRPAASEPIASARDPAVEDPGLSPSSPTGDRAGRLPHSNLRTGWSRASTAIRWPGSWCGRELLGLYEHPRCSTRSQPRVRTPRSACTLPARLRAGYLALSATRRPSTLRSIAELTSWPTRTHRDQA